MPSEINTTGARERAILVALELPNAKGSLDERLAELSDLADTAGCDAVAVVQQKRQKPDGRTFIGKGKVGEIKEAVEEHEADLVIFGANLSPAQARNLETELGRTVVDRTQLILDIFALRAKTGLARWEVELAQLQYELPRYRHMWTHLSRMEGGVGAAGVVGTRGPGETQLEVDRRRARERIHILQERLRTAEQQKAVAGRRREDSFTVALVGYTNVGKSTLMNRLTGAGVFVEDRLFATLDATTRRLDVDGEEILLSDTVGFIRDLPHSLVASFHATLAEVREADLLLHVCDLSHDELSGQIAAVLDVLVEIGAQDQPTLMVYNKADAVPDELDLERIAERHGDGVVISARTGLGLDALTGRLVTAARRRHRRVVVHIPYQDGRTAAYLEAHAKVLAREFDERGAIITALVAPEDVGRLEPYLTALDA